MLQIIDQRWREHLSEMDYLREGINLRAMGQQDPLVAWQREGFEMFGQMMDAHRRRLPAVRHARPGAWPSRAAEPDLGQASYLAADDPVQGDAAMLAAFARPRRPSSEAAAAAGVPAGDGGVGPGVPAAPADDGETQAPIVKSEREKIGRNEPCWCGSGKKFKLCHGAS